MKTAIKLVLIYFVMQILAALLVMPFTMLYSYAVNGTIDDTSTAALAPSILLGFVGMGAYLWRKGYLKGDKRIWSPVSVAYLGWSAVIGLATIFLIDFVACFRGDAVSRGDYQSAVAKVQSGEGCYPFRSYFRNFPY